jgi:glycosyltransferase involved in cell wall biosynthesis
MRVLMISKALVAGTSQRKLEEIAKLPDIELTLVTPPYWQSDDGSKQVLERLYTNGYRIIETPIKFNGNFHLHYYPQLGRIMREVRPQVVHIDEEPYNLTTYLAMRLARQQKARPLFFTWQNLYRDYPLPFRQMELSNYKHAAAAIVGNRDASAVLRRKGYQGPIQIIPQFGFDTEIYKRSAPRIPRQPDDPFIIGFIGRLKEEKGLSLIVEALTMLPDYCRAVFIGNGPMKATLTEQAARLGLTERVIFKSGVPTSQVPREMEQWDVHVLPSLTRPNWIEQFGRTLAEAMSCETPVIGSSSGEIPHVIGDAGLVFKEGDARELSRCVEKLLTDPALYAELAKRGRQRVLENYTQQRIAQQTYEVYLSILQSVDNNSKPSSQSEHKLV